MQQIFTVYRWTNPQTMADYPFLALAQDRSALLLIGNYGVAFEWGLSDEAAQLLATDFQPTGDRLGVDLLAVRGALEATFLHPCEFGSVAFDEKLRPCRLQLSLRHPDEAGKLGLPPEEDPGPEYVLEGFGSYLRFYRSLDRCGPVSLPERAMLDVCISTFAELAARCTALLTEPPPPRYWAGG